MKTNTTPTGTTIPAPPADLIVTGPRRLGYYSSLPIETGADEDEMATVTLTF